MVRTPDLEARARQFAQNMQDLLNRTVCDNAKVRALVHSDALMVVGTCLRTPELTTQPVRLRTATRAKLWIDVSCSLGLDDDEGKFLTVRSSYCGISFGEEHEHPLLHYDFERDKARYAEAHLQVYGRHEHLEGFLEELGRGRDQLYKLHLPLGGRRFRPALEDIIEFLIVEGLVEPKPNWEKTLDPMRREFRLRQVAAAVRKHHGTAKKELERFGYTVIPPTDIDSSLRATIARLLAPSVPKQRTPDGDNHTTEEWKPAVWRSRQRGPRQRRRTR